MEYSKKKRRNKKFSKREKFDGIRVSLIEMRG